MIQSILSLVDAVLSIVEIKMRRKYIDKVEGLRRDWYAEFNKPREERNNAVLDNIELELRLTVASLAADLRASKA